MKNNNLELLSSALRTVGGNFDVPTLDLIFSVKDLIDAKGAEISIGEIGLISNQIAEKYKLNQ